MRFLRTNTACRVTVGPFFDKTDGVTPETGLTVTSCKLTLMVDTGNVPTLVIDASATASGGNNDMVHVTGDDAGFYDLELTAAQTNYLGRAMLAITDAATHCPVFHEFMIIPAMMYDSVILGTDRLDTNVTHIGDTLQTARDIGASVLLSSGTGTGQISLTSGGVSLANGAHGGAAAEMTLKKISVTNSAGNAVEFVSSGGNGHGLYVIGEGSGDGVHWLGGSTGHGLNAQGGVTSGNGINASALGTGVPIVGSITGNLTGSVGSVAGAVGSVTGSVGGNVAGSVGSVVGAVGSVTGNVGGNVVGTVASVVGNIGGNLNGNVEGSVSGSVSGSVGSVTGAVGSVTGSVGSVVGNVGGNVTGSTASVAGAVGSVTGNVGGDVQGKVLGGGSGTITSDGVRAASVTGAVGSVTGAVGSVTGSVTVGTNSDKTGYALTSDYDAAKTAASASTASSILTDTNELQSDWTNGGRLDLLLDAILEDTGTTIPTSIAALPNAAANAAALLDLSNGIETSITPRQALRLILAAAAGKVSGAASTTIVIRNVGDTKDRITATVSSEGNRTAVSVDAT